MKEEPDAAHQRKTGNGEPKKGQSRKVLLFSMTLISWFFGPSILGVMSAEREVPDYSFTSPHHQTNDLQWFQGLIDYRFAFMWILLDLIKYNRHVREMCSSNTTDFNQDVSLHISNTCKESFSGALLPLLSHTGDSDSNVSVE